MSSACTPLLANTFTSHRAPALVLPGGFDVSMRTYSCSIAISGVIATGLGM
jgi:hypothetical protein